MYISLIEMLSSLKLSCHFNVFVHFFSSVGCSESVCLLCDDLFLF